MLRHTIPGALLVIVGMVALTGPAGASTHFGTAAVACTYTSQLFEFPGGFQGEIDVTNTGTEPLEDWRVRFDMTGDAHVEHSWSAVFYSVHSPMRVGPERWNTVIPVNGNVTFGFSGIRADTVSITNLTLNDVACVRS
jgi:hypothetical protein